MTFDANTFGPDEAPVPDSYTDGMMTTQDVLIDVDGNRKNFIVGWYDHDDSEWCFQWCFHDVFLEIDATKIRWSFLPLAIYETNPELRKTVKI